ncbi:alpha/beta hydrolase [Kineobactrum sediminis]|uniref:Alpha/beta hydrolase n=1 Tax=Kineobactrum sediminis TaxID=1905677 RepID=A0A2N5Y599_9GAMM|nr:alpha/beta hydrolase [Kineobactrum sediminis]PLW83573.1 alpha/beta hydrolase [Kineobactrum sediminis]
MAEYRDITYTSKDGLALYARDYPGPGPGAPVVLCMHGLTRNSADFAGLAPHLARHFRVLVADQRGRGRSEYDSNPVNYHPGTYIEDMFRLLDVEAVGRALLVGTSMGGLMALLMAATDPDRFAGLVLNDIGPEVDPAGLARIKTYVGKAQPVSDWAGAVAQCRALNSDAFPDFTERQWSDFAGALFREVDGRPVLAYDPAIAEPMAATDDNAVPPDLWPVFDSIRHLPMLLLRGIHSDILAPDCVAQMQRRKPDLVFAEIPHRGHAPTLDESASRLAIDRFLAAL